MENERPRLYRAITCNFCHRSEIAFATKGIEIETIDIDLVNRPKWYATKASAGSVPLLEWNGNEIHPSTVINEFVDDQWPEPALFPDDPVERAAARSWIEWFNDGPCPAYERRLMNVRPEREAALERSLIGTLEEMETKLADRGYGSGYWHGESLGVVDATTAPMFVRFVGLKHFHGFDIPVELGRVRTWRDALLDDPHVRSTSPNEDELLAAYEGYRRVLTKAAEAGIEVPVAKGD